VDINVDFSNLTTFFGTDAGEDVEVSDTMGMFPMHISSLGTINDIEKVAFSDGSSKQGNTDRAWFGSMFVDAIIFGPGGMWNPSPFAPRDPE